MVQYDVSGYDDWTTQLHRWLDFPTAWHLGLAVSLIIAGLGAYLMLRATAIGARRQPHRRHRVRGELAIRQLALPPISARVLLLGTLDLLGVSCAWLLVPLFTKLALVGETLQTTASVVLALLVGAAFVEPNGTSRLRGTESIGLRLWRDALPWLVLAGGLGCVSLLGAPSLLGSPRSVDLAKVLGRDLLDVAYFGTLPFVFAILALFRAEAPRAGRALAATGLILPLTPLVGPLYHRVQIIWILGGLWLFIWYWSAGARNASPTPVEHLGRIPRRVGDRQPALPGARRGAVAPDSYGGLRARRRWGRPVRHVLGLDAGAGRPLARRAADLGAEAAGVELRGDPRSLGVFLTASSAEGRHVLDGGRHLPRAGRLSSGWVTGVDPDSYPVYGERDDLGRLRRAAAGGAVIVFRGPDSLLLPPNLLAAHGIRTIE